MSRKTATAVKEAQPDLLGGAPPQKSVAKTEPKAKPASKEVALAGPAEPKSMLAVIAAAASNPACDVGKMQALLDIQEKIEAKQERREFIQDFIALQAELPSINRDGKIEILEKGKDGNRVAGRDKVQQSTPYATFNNIMKVVKPLLRKHNFGLSFETEPSVNGERIIVKGILVHASGFERTTAFPLPAETSGSKNNVQGWGSSLSYGKRYCTVAILNIVSHASEDIDRDGHDPRPSGKKGSAPTEIDGEIVESGPAKITLAQHDKLVEAIEDCGASRKGFCSAYKIETVADLGADMYETAMKACRAKKENTGGDRGQGRS